MSSIQAADRTTGPGKRPKATSHRLGPRRFVLRLGLEVAVVGVLFTLYNAGRLVITGQEAVARANADLVRRLEALLHLPSESDLQGAVAAVPPLLEAANHYYVAMHFPVMIVFLLWGFLARPRPEYVWARNLLVTVTFLGLTIHSLFPLAPPRMFPQWGFLDTLATTGSSPYEGAAAAVANQYAAMPSLHIGWAILIAFVLARTGSRAWGLLGISHALTTVLVVVVTANHWWLDGLVAAVLLALAAALFPGPRPAARRAGGAHRPPLETARAPASR